jgi:VWA domain containing CoxE-like protein
MTQTTLPFSGFLDALRDKGFGVGLHEYLALGKLLDAWGATDRDQIRNGIAALIARHEDEVRSIKKLFDEFYPRERVVIDDGRHGKLGHFRFVRLVKSAGVWAAALTLIALAVGAVSLVRWTKTIELPAVRPLVVETLKPIQQRDDKSEVLPTFDPPTPDPPASTIPLPPPRTAWSGIAALSGGALILTAGALWGRSLRAGARKWTARAWQSALASLPGPYHGTLVLRDYVSRMPRADIEDTATVLGRSFAGDVRGTELDVLESLRRTLRAGLQPHLIFRPRRVQETIVTLVDVSPSMAMYARKIESFRADLRRQGIALEAWFFDADISGVARHPHGPTTPLEGFLRLHGEGPVMILSAGAGVPVTIARKNDKTVPALQKRARLVWITPIADPQLWPEALQRLSLPIVSMTRTGLLRAAQILAHDDPSGGVVSFARASVSRPVTERDVEELRRLASLVPYPTPELLELLRQRFAPEIPESAVLYAVDTRAASANLPFKMSDDDIRDLLKKVRAETPEREAAVRAYLIQVLEDSEPVVNSAAHLRWQASMAIHKAQIAELAGADASAAIDTVRELYHGPLWEEVRGMVERLAPVGAVTDEMRKTVHAKDTAPPDFRAASAPSAKIAKPIWSGPGWRVLATATAIALAVAAISYVAGPFRVQASVDRAYTLTFAPGLATGNPGRLIVRAVPGSGAPRTVQLFRDGAAWNQPVALADDSATVSVDDGPAHLYDARSVASRDTLAASNSVWAPSVLVIIDAHAWAKVTVDWENRPSTLTDKTLYRDELTPFAVRLPEGDYTLSFVNGTDTLKKSVTVSTAGDRTFSYMMPGFSSDDVLRQLGLPRSPTSAKN